MLGCKDDRKAEPLGRGTQYLDGFEGFGSLPTKKAPVPWKKDKNGIVATVATVGMFRCSSQLIFTPSDHPYAPCFVAAQGSTSVGPLLQAWALVDCATQHDGDGVSTAQKRRLDG